MLVRDVRNWPVMEITESGVFGYEKVYAQKSKCWNGLRREGCGNIESMFPWVP